MPPGDSVEREATTLPFRDGAFDVAYLIAVTHHMPPPATARALAEAKRVARRAVATAWQPDRGREVAPSVYEVPRGTRTMRLYYRYGVHEMLQLAPTKPLSIGIIRRGKQPNHYIVL
jgi:ubiquinone/menaquinone biosynthesis C-methylase UbiE